MILPELYITGQRVDLSDDSIVALSFQSMEIADLKDRKANFSNSFKVPKTANNQRIFEFADSFASETDLPYKNLPAFIVQGGITIIPIGLAQIKSSDDNYNVTVLSGIIDFFKERGDKLLSELDLSVWDHVWDVNAIVASQPATDGYKYPIIDYGTMSDVGDDVSPQLLRPATFEHTVVSQIIKEGGYTEAGDFFARPDYKKILLPYTINEVEKSPAFIALQLFQAGKTADEVFNYTTNPNQQPANVGQNVSGQIKPDDDSTGTNFDNNNNFDIVAGEWVVKETGYYNLSAIVPFQLRVVSINAPVMPPSHVATFLRLGVTFQKISGGVTTLIGNSFFQIGSGFTSAALQVDTFSTTRLQAGDVVRIGYTAGITSTVYDGFNPQYGVTIDWELTLYQTNAGQDFIVSNSFVPAVGYGEQWKLADTLPKMKQVDLLKSLFQRFAIVPDIDALNRTIRFVRFEELYLNKSRAVDWSDKLNEGSTLQEYGFGSYAQKNWLRYKADNNDKDIIPETGDHYIVVNDQTLQDEKTMFTLPFAATHSHLRLEEITVPLIRKTQATEFTESVEPRILIDRIVDISGNAITNKIHLDDGLGQTDDIQQVCIPYFIDPTETFSLGFNSSLLTDNYQGLILMLFRARMLKGEFNLNNLDIVKLNHFIPVYLKQYSQYFYRNKIDKFVNDGRLTTVELIRM